MQLFNWSAPVGVSEAELWVTLKRDFKNDIERSLFSGRLTESAVKISESG